MTQSTLAPVFSGLRVGLHTLLVGLAVFAVVRAYLGDSPYAFAALVVAALFVALYAVGVVIASRGRGSRPLAVLWVGSLTAIWAVLLWVAPDSAYLVFPLFFLFLHVLPMGAGIAAVVAATGISIVSLGLHLGFNIGGVIGPIIGAVFSVLIGLAYRALTREAQEREELLAELMHTRQQLASTEREQGALAERARLAREIHDTVAQGLSSIQMLLHAAERSTPEPGLSHLRLARETAAESLADTRGIIRALTPPSLDGGLVAALERLAEDQSKRSGIAMRVISDGEPNIAMSTSTALLRIAQGAISNVVRHSGADSAEIRLSHSADGGDVELIVRDSGVGFDPDLTQGGAGGGLSFGLRAIHERADQLGGSARITSVRGSGTELVVTIPGGSAAAGRPRGSNRGTESTR